jgi:hypothetical protein
MLHCPNCSRKWPDQMSVLAHMNQPLGSCYSYQEEMTSIADELRQFHHHKKMQTIMGNSHWEDTMAEVQVDVDVDMIELEPGVQADPAGVPLEKDPHFIEEYKGAARSFGSGTTFMDKFNSDAYQSERIDTPYYPFASKYEWELASFLLLSDLSMASITKLLSLHLVSPMTKM